MNEHESEVFGRPAGVTGSFDPSQAPPRQSARTQGQQAPPKPIAQAFGRPRGSAATVQRGPKDDPARFTATENPENSSALWGNRAEASPWRNPDASVLLGRPAGGQDSPEDPEKKPSGLLSTRDLLFGRRVQPRALATLTAGAVLLAMVGGFIGRITAEEGNPLTNPEVTLAEAEPGAERPAGVVAGVAKRVVPAVVAVETRVGDQGGSGSGVVIDGNGYVLTNNHVISQAADTPNSRVSAVFHDGTRVPARIVGRDVKTDLAVIKVEVTNPTVAQLGRSGDLTVGDQVIAIGSPLGLNSTVTTGIVSSVHRPVRLAGDGTDTNAVIDAIQTDAAINPGNSGGALVDAHGAVIGINSAIRTLGSEGQGGSIGLGFAIPIDQARRIAQDLIRTGRVWHADLGVNASSVTDGNADGAQVRNVREGSIAAQAGIQEGDVIVRVGGRPIHGADELVVAVDQHPFGATLPITLVRGGRELVLDAHLR